MSGHYEHDASGILAEHRGGRRDLASIYARTRTDEEEAALRERLEDLGGVSWETFAGASWDAMTGAPRGWLVWRLTFTEDRSRPLRALLDELGVLLGSDAPEPVVEHATAVIAEDLPDGGARLSRVDGTVIGPRSIVRPEARRPPPEASAK